MHLTTRCPRCDTVFQASLAQLQLRKGFVRCVQCAHIFDGYDAVVPEAQGSEAVSRLTSTPVEAVAAPTPAPAPAPATPAPTSAPTPPLTAVAAGPASVVAPAVVRHRAAASVPGAGGASTVQEADEAMLSGAADAAAVPLDDVAPGALPAPAPEITFSVRHDGPVRHDADVPRQKDFSISDGHRDTSSLRGEPVWRVGDDDTAVAETQGHDDDSMPIRAEPRRVAPAPEPVPDFLDAAPRRSFGIAFWFWSVLSLAGLVLLAAQAAVIYRVQLASQMPAARPLLERLCTVAGCQVDYPRHLSQIAILSSSLRVQPRSGTAQESDTSQLSLLLTLRNNDERPQQWPTLMLDLTDFSGAVVVRKRLSPADYLPPAQAGQPFGARSEIAVRLPISVKGAKVNGYQLKPFFP